MKVRIVLMPRHRGKFNPENPSPYEISRSKIENFVKCVICKTFFFGGIQGNHIVQTAY